jgi:hypothetical protein
MLRTGSTHEAQADQLVGHPRLRGAAAPRDEPLTRRGPGTTITLPAHGRLELSAKHTGMLNRELEKAGFDRDQVREELGL